MSTTLIITSLIGLLTMFYLGNSIIPYHWINQKGHVDGPIWKHALLTLLINGIGFTILLPHWKYTGGLLFLTILWMILINFLWQLFVDGIIYNTKRKLLHNDYYDYTRVSEKLIRFRDVMVLAGLLITFIIAVK